MRNLNFQNWGLFSNSFETACARNFNAKKLLQASGWKICLVLHSSLKLQKICLTARPSKRRTIAHFVRKIN